MSMKNGNGETMKKLWNRIARYRVLLLMSIVLAAATVIMQLYVPMLFGDAIDCIVATHQVDFDRVGMFLGRVALFAVLLCHLFRREPNLPETAAALCASISLRQAAK